MHPDAYIGLPGEIVHTIGPHTEADRVALLTDFLLQFGNAVNSGAHVRVGGTLHRPVLFVVIVGQTSRARKAQAHGDISAVMGEADPEWCRDRNMSGIATGEGL